ncbi:hypothetical protein FEF33_04435 [Moraxella osloensis]|nr:hypothetical protein FEF33_04435 [Moraxella osloensis]RVU80823.1 hypothetical protein EOL70_30280 [Leucothrix sargassi]
MIMIGNPLKSAQEKTGWGSFTPQLYTHGYMSSQAELHRAKAIAGAVGYMLNLPAYSYHLTAKQGEASKAFYYRWMFREKNGELLDNIQLSVAHAKKIEEVLERNEDKAYFKDRFNARLLEVIAIREATNFLPIMSHKRDSFGYEQLYDLVGNPVDITEYIIHRKKYIHDLKLFLMNMVKAYNQVCRYVINLDKIGERGDSAMYLAAEYGRIVHRSFADSLLYGFHLSPLYSNNPLFMGYDEETRDAFKLAGMCEDLKISLEQGTVEYLPTTEFIYNSQASTRQYLKDNLVVTEIDNELHTKLLDVRVIEAYYPFLAASESEPSEELEDNAFALACEYWEKTQTITYDRSLLGKYSYLIAPNSSLFDILNSTVLDIFDIRQLGELAVAQAKFIDYYLSLDLKRKDYIVKMLFNSFQRYANLGDGLQTIFNPASSDFYADVDLMEDLYFYHDKGATFLSSINKLSNQVRNNMRDLVASQADGQENPIHHYETNTWQVAIEPTLMPDGSYSIRFDLGDTKIAQNNRGVLNADNEVMANVMSRLQ